MFSYYDFLDIDHAKFLPGKAKITVLDLVTTTGLTSADLDDLMNNIQNQMLEVFRQSASLPTSPENIREEIRIDDLE